MVIKCHEMAANIATGQAYNYKEQTLPNVLLFGRTLRGAARSRVLAGKMAQHTEELQQYSYIVVQNYENVITENSLLQQNTHRDYSTKYRLLLCVAVVVVLAATTATKSFHLVPIKA